MGPYYDHQVGRFEPLDPVQHRDFLLARARQARADATAAMFAALWASLRRAARTAAAFVRHPGAGAALRPPHGELRRHDPRLTGGCT